MLEEQALDPERHNRKGFACGIPALDEYLQRFAVQQSKKGVTVVRVLVDDSMPAEILGYYSLSAAQIDVNSLDEADKKQLPRYPVPCFRMGRLACSAIRQGKGIGKLLIGCAVARCMEAKKQVAAYALIVDAKNAQAKTFYKHYAFKACVDSPMTLYLAFGAYKQG